MSDKKILWWLVFDFRSQWGMGEICLHAISTAEYTTAEICRRHSQIVDPKKFAGHMICRIAHFFYEVALKVAFVLATNY